MKNSRLVQKVAGAVPLIEGWEGMLVVGEEGAGLAASVSQRCSDNRIDLRFLLMLLPPCSRRNFLAFGMGKLQQGY